MNSNELSEKAVSCLREGYSCAQSVFSTLASQYGIDQGAARGIAAGFGGGMARRGETCGAVTGALMGIGLSHAREVAAVPSAREAVYEQAQLFLKRFGAGHGSLLCRELLGCDLAAPGGMERARSEGLFSSVCPVLVRDAVLLASEISALPVSFEGKSSPHHGSEKPL